MDKKAEYPLQITNDVNNIGRKTLQALPIDIKKEFVKTRVTVYFSLNAKGDVYHIIFRGGLAGISLTEAQWLKVFDSFHRMKSEMAKLISSDNTHWEVRWVYPVSKYLQDADN